MGCRNVTANCIDILSDANSPVTKLSITVCADLAMEKIGKSTLSISDLTVGCSFDCSCAATDFGIEGLLNGRKPIYRT